MARPSIAIIGHGNLGRTLAGALKTHGYRVDEVVRRNRRPRLEANVIWFCVPDMEITKLAKELATDYSWKGKIALHSSGALPAAALAPLKKRGAAIASAHPLNTFVAASKPDFTGVPFAIEGDLRAARAAQAIAKKLTRNAPILRIKPELKPLYHAMGAFASPLFIALLANAEVVGHAAGVKDVRPALVKILRTTLANYERNGAAASFSGPIVRGDAATVRKHLVALAKLPQQRDVYRALADSAIALLPSKIKHL